VSPLLLSAVFLSLSSVADAGAADPALRADLAALQAAYEYGRYAEVLVRANARIDGGGVESSALAEFQKLAGLSAFNLRRFEEANRHVAALLRLDPDFSLDPFVYPPPVVAYVEKQRQTMAAELEFLREQRRQREAAAKSALEERAALAREAEAQRKQLEAISRQVNVRTVEKQNVLVNFVPFGAGQFQERRVGPGVGFAVAEGVLAIVSIVSYFIYGGLITTRTVTVEGFPGGPETFIQTGIPAAQASEAQAWRTTKVTSGIAFYAVYAAGVIDALLHYQPEVVTVRVETLPPPAPLAPPPAAAPPATQAPGGPRVELTPAPRGSVGLGVGLRF
jgi:hypothetical protein